MRNQEQLAGLGDWQNVSRAKPKQLSLRLSSSRVGRKAAESRSASVIVRMLFGFAKAAGWKQYDLAKKLRVTNITLSRWKNGKTSPTMPDCEAFAELLNLEFGLNERKEPQ